MFQQPLLPSSEQLFARCHRCV